MGPLVVVYVYVGTDEYDPLQPLSYKWFGHKGRQHVPMCLIGIRSSKDDNY